MNFGRAKRKSLFLSTTILRGRRLKDDNEPGGATPPAATDDGFQVGPGFAEAAEKMGSDDNRGPEQRGQGATQEIPDGSAPAEGEGANEKGDNSGEGEPKPKPKKDRQTSQYVRDLKREIRELKALVTQSQNPQNGVLPTNPENGNSSPTSAAPDPSDAEKYPLGVLDDGYTADLIQYHVNQALTQADQTKKATEAAQLQIQQKVELQQKVEQLAAKGSEIFDDYEELVVEGGVNGDYLLSETTFTAAAEAENGPAILYALASDPEEAARVNALSPFQQMKYIATKDAEIAAAKPKPRVVPKAGTPPENLPRGRNASAPIRADTDNLDDFRKIFYQK